MVDPITSSIGLPVSSASVVVLNMAELLGMAGESRADGTRQGRCARGARGHGKWWDRRSGTHAVPVVPGRVCPGAGRLRPRREDAAEGVPRRGAWCRGASPGGAGPSGEGQLMGCAPVTGADAALQEAT
ncbi:hypothetical protein Stsp01_12240 [Streptomyces sp. NBRC 13847]|nr:hypothetical protein Stsp01_12240 [Streptomyces sp. NBRC 13847]